MDASVSPAPAVSTDAGVDDDDVPMTLENAAAYRDEPVLRELVRSPAWSFAQRDPDEMPANIYGCAGDVDQQSCEPDPCFTRDLPCRTACMHTCDAGETRCRSAAVTCASTCTTDVCRLACARSEAACLDDAVAAKDRCLSAGCMARTNACNAALVRRYRADHCLGWCRRCHVACRNADSDACTMNCMGRRGHCSEDEQALCMTSGEDGPSLPGEGSADDGSDAGPGDASTTTDR